MIREVEPELVKPMDWFGLPHDGWYAVRMGSRYIALVADPRDAQAIIRDRRGACAAAPRR